MKPNAMFLGLAALLAVTACSREEALLQGEREGIRNILTESPAPVDESAQVNRSQPVTLPAAVSNANWTQAIGTPSTRTDHPALSAAPQRIWSTSIGAGDGRKVRITADPVVAGGRIFALDAQSQVSAVSTSGEVLWRRDLVPPNDSASDASGGGLAFGDGRLFVSSGFGLITALDAETGAELWQQNLRATGTGNPTVLGDLVYLVAGDDVAWALDTQNGRIRWQLTGTPDINNVMGGPAPAVSEKYVVFAFGAAEVQGAFRQGGLRLWDAQIAGQREGYAGARVADITGDPVIDGDKVFVGSHSGRMVALGLANGERLWTANQGPLNRVWPSGDSVYMISDRNELVRLQAEDGEQVWSVKLQLFTKDRPRRQSEIVAHHGPVMAGGQLVVASGDGLLRFFDPRDGALIRTVDLPGGATTNPVVAGGALYVVSTNGQLHAFR